MSGLTLDSRVINVIDDYMENRRRMHNGIWRECTHDLKKVMGEYIGFPKLNIRVKGHYCVEDTPDDRNYDRYFRGSSIYHYNWYEQVSRNQRTIKLKSWSWFVGNARKINEAFIRDRYGSIDNAFMAHIYFVELADSFSDWKQEKENEFMRKMEIDIAKKTGDIAKRGSAHGGVANLLKILTKTMEKQGADIRSIAKVQYSICTQAGIYIPDEFITDVAVALNAMDGVVEPE